MLHRYPSLGLRKLTDLARQGFTLLSDTSPQLGGPLDTNGRMVQWSKGSDVASASALNLGTDGNFFDVTGTTTITSIASETQAPFVVLQFDGSLTLTHHATNLILPGKKSITTQAGDIATFVQYASGQWVCITYQRAEQTTDAWVLLDDTSVSAAASYTLGTSDFGNGIESYRDIMVELINVLPASANGDLRFRTDSGGGDAGDSGASDYTWTTHVADTGSQNGGGNTADAEIVISGHQTTLQPTTSGMGVTGRLIYYDFNQAVEGVCVWHTVHENEGAANEIVNVIGGGARLDATARDFIYFDYSSGNIASGRFRIWGRR